MDGIIVVSLWVACSIVARRYPRAQSRHRLHHHRRRRNLYHLPTDRGEEEGRRLQVGMEIHHPSHREVRFSWVRR